MAGPRTRRGDGPPPGSARRGALEPALVAALLATLAAWVESGRGDPDVNLGTALIALLLLAGCWLVEQVRVPVGLDRAGRVVTTSGVNALLLPAAILLPPALFIPVAFAVELPYLRGRDRRQPWVGGCVRVADMSAASICFTLLAPPGAPRGVVPQTVLALVVAGTALLMVESLLVARAARLRHGLSARELPLLERHELGRDLPDVLLGALLCLLLPTPSALVLVVPLLVWRQQSIRAYATYLRSHLDPKTGLLSLPTFLEMAAGEVARAQRTGQPLALVILDLDGLKQVNTEHGHLAGDVCITTMAGVLTQGVRTEDLTSRFGGDEFCLLLPDTTGVQAAAIAERVRGGARQASVPGIDVTLSVSIGVASCTATEDVTSLMTRADEALRAAKSAGGDQVQFADAAGAAAL